MILPDSVQYIAFSAIYIEELAIPPGREGFVSYGDARHQSPIHRHQELEFNLVVRGTARYLLRDRQYHLRSGSLIWLFPEQDHILLDRSPDYAHWVVCFTPDLVDRSCRTAESAPLRSANPTGWFCTELPIEHVERLEQLLGELWQPRAALPNDNDRFNAGLAYTLLMAWSFYAAAVQNGESGGETQIHPAVSAAIRLIRTSIRSGDLYQQNLPLAEVAAQCGVSTDYLSRLFHRDIGLTPVSFRNREKLRRFIEVYGQGRGHTLLEAALEVGFGSYSQFHRVFREEMGVSPQFYRNLPTAKRNPGNQTTKENP